MTRQEKIFSKIFFNRLLVIILILLLVSIVCQIIKRKNIQAQSTELVKFEPWGY